MFRIWFLYFLFFAISTQKSNNMKQHVKNPTFILFIISICTVYFACGSCVPYVYREPKHAWVCRVRMWMSTHTQCADPSYGLALRTSQRIRVELWIVEMENKMRYFPLFITRSTRLVVSSTVIFFVHIFCLPGIIPPNTPAQSHKHTPDKW